MIKTSDIAKHWWPWELRWCGICWTSILPCSCPSEAQYESIGWWNDAPYHVRTLQHSSIGEWTAGPRWRKENPSSCFLISPFSIIEIQTTIPPFVLILPYFCNSLTFLWAFSSHKIVYMRSCASPSSSLSLFLLHRTRPLLFSCSLLPQCTRHWIRTIYYRLPYH